MEVHEHPVLSGSEGELVARIDHHDFRSLEQYRKKHEEYAKWEAHRFTWLHAAGEAEWNPLTRRQLFKYKNLNRWWFGSFYFCVSYFFKRGFLDGRAGFYLAWLKRRYFHNIRAKIKQNNPTVT